MMSNRIFFFVALVARKYSEDFWLQNPLGSKPCMKSFQTVWLLMLAAMEEIQVRVPIVSCRRGYGGTVLF